jgi:hypothetical protein
MARESRRYQCKIPGCPRTDAQTTERPTFGSSSDLNRHYREIHGIDTDGNAVGKHCCVHETCKRYAVGFRRWSNLMDHLQKMHDGKIPNNALSAPPEHTGIPRLRTSISAGFNAVQQGVTHTTPPPEAEPSSQSHSAATELVTPSSPPDHTSTNFDPLNMPSFDEDNDVVVQFLKKEIDSREAEMKHIVKKLQDDVDALNQSLYTRRWDLIRRVG